MHRDSGADQGFGEQGISNFSEESRDGRGILLKKA